MAIIRAPAGIDPGSATEPTSHGQLINQTAPDGLMPPPAILTRPVLSAPSLDQLANLSAGYAL